MNAGGFHFELEDLPLRAAHGRLKVSGWCLDAAGVSPPEVRLTVDDRHFTIVRRHERADVVAALSAPPGGRACGFTIEGRLRPGVYVSRLEASRDGSKWAPLREFSVVATAGRLHAVVEQPPPGRPVRASTRLQGWCVHPDQALSELWLHYGNQRVRCETGLPREDVPRLVPGAPDAPRAGFIAAKNLPVGCGPLRLKARTMSGEPFFAATTHRIDIRTDEDHREPLDLSGVRADLGPVRRPAEEPPPTPTGHPRRVLFVLYGDFTSNSAIHVGSLANELQDQGHACWVAVARHKETVRYLHPRHFAAIDYDEARRLNPPPDIVHAWTTREDVRRLSEDLCAGSAARLVVHLEDHESSLLATALGRPWSELLALDDDALDRLVPPSLSHPRRSARFLAGAAGVTVIIDRLRELAPADKPQHLIWPAAASRFFFPRPLPAEFRHALGWPADHTVLFYHGNVHESNRAEVRELYRAVALLNRGGPPCTLLRTGRDFCDYLGDLEDEVAPHVLNLGQIEHQHHLPPLMALADIFVQPGLPDEFNDYRFPSKLPEFFALGRPVILPRTNLGLIARHGLDAYVLDRADAEGIAAAVQELRHDPALSERLSRGAAEFAATHFSWRRSAEALAAFYETLLA